MSIIGKNVFWYRNAPDKDADKPLGSGECVYLSLMERAAEGVCVIVDEHGNIHEKVLSLVKVDMSYGVKLAEAQKAIESLHKELAEAYTEIEQLKKKSVTLKQPVKKE